MKVETNDNIASIQKVKQGNIYLEFVDEGISAGFPSPADDFKNKRISLDEELVKDKNTTYYARVSGESMIGAGLDNNDLLVIDKSITPKDGKIAVCYVDGEFTVKRLKITKECVFLMPENDNYKPIKVTKDKQLLIWGIVTYVIKKL
ncbi:translesion error-prone DNA polymerase V autoproteolytic subunit [Kordia sp. YSTF-M3]|uniref:Translesion error-prone DNA polymerase V autoproteolytic subunit n=1 Tax=Kordia aestuariivivens TaxID=2759037 RepID=A0ABR7Q8Z2_9FLAO|nr:translesion error-prone DNA polymerase V autoproteolytic subunit [Kordia aestuariivivens]MBC8754836.1 translesion error-prone DNA polymerase V autoproteolytic subunit [Kordia aestuariivivens]